ncbi:nucleotide-binding protein [Yunchengibacter salinarum]|uniref:nucleotide-binding protein n=1 Tax=Yunchengibacter salinarum TaxID=3133399 RepID=UPI0035B6436D
MTTDTAHKDAEQAQRRLITVASGKGGVGKTWVSVTLSQALAYMNRRVLLFDGDLGLANVDIQLGLMPDRDLGDVISGQRTMRDVIDSHSAKGDPIGYDIVPGKSGSGALGQLARQKLESMRGDLIDLASDYDHVLLDLAAGVDQSVTTLSHHKGKILTVMTGDPTSLTDAYAFIKLTAMRNPKADIMIVVNNVADKRSGERAYEAIKRACEGFLKISPPLAGIIRSDSRVGDSVRAQVPLLARHPQSEAAADIKALAGRLTKGS